MGLETLLAGLAGLVGGLIAYVLNKFTDRFVSTPRIKILSDDVSRIEPDMWYLFGGIRRGSAQFLIKIMNENIFVAKGCRLYLTEIEMLDAVPERFLLQTSIPLPWSISRAGVAIPEEDGTVAGQTEMIGKFDLPKGLTLTAVVVGISTNLEPIILKVDEAGETQDDPPIYVPEEYNERINVGMPINFTSGYSMRHDRTYRITLVATADNAEPYYFRFDVGFERTNGIFHIKLSNRVAGYRSKVLRMIDDFKGALEADIRASRV